MRLGKHSNRDFGKCDNMDTTLVQLIITPVAMLATSWFTSHNQRKEKQEEFERTKSKEREQRRIEAGFDFLETFSKPIKRIIEKEYEDGQSPITGEYTYFALCEHRVDDLTPYLRAAMRLREFGDYLTGNLQYGFHDIEIQGKHEQVKTLSDVIELTMKLRYKNESDLLSEKTLDEFEALRLIAVKYLSTDIISSIPWKQENTNAKRYINKSWWQFWK